MKQVIKNLIRSTLQKFDIGITKYSTLTKLETRARESAIEDLEFLLTLPNDLSQSVLKYWHKSKSQYRQDLFVLSVLNFKRNGYFVEFGAANGVDLSNTYLMEKEFGWTGILAEPANCWHPSLRANRASNIEKDCVWTDSNMILKFNEVDIGELSTIDSYNNKDIHYKDRKNGKRYDVKTISLNDLLSKYDAPKQIDYLSIDTEGSEFEILNNFDFSKHQFSVITCEHNFTPMREKIFQLLSNNGYIRKCQDISHFDDWYIYAPC